MISCRSIKAEPANSVGVHRVNYDWAKKKKRKRNGKAGTKTAARIATILEASNHDVGGINTIHLQPYY